MSRFVFGFRVGRAASSLTTLGLWGMISQVKVSESSQKYLARAQRAAWDAKGWGTQPLCSRYGRECLSRRQQVRRCAKRKLAMIGCRVLTGMSFPRAATNAVEARSRDVLPLRSSPVETLKAWPNAVFSRASQRHRNRCVRTCL